MAYFIKKIFKRIIMTPTVRRNHRVIWIILAIALPILLFMAYSAIPEKAIQKELFQIENQDSN